MRSSLRVVAVLSLCGALLMPSLGCNAADFAQQFGQYTSQIVPAVQTVLAILQLFGVASKPELPARIGADVAAAQSLVSDFAKAPADSQPGIRVQIEGVEATLNADLQEVFLLAHVTNPNNQAKVTALLSLIEAAVAEGFALIPRDTSTPNLAKAAYGGAKLESKDYVGSFNKMLVARTGDKKVDALTPTLKLHKHRSLWVKIGTLGIVR